MLSTLSPFIIIVPIIHIFHTIGQTMKDE